MALVFNDRVKETSTTTGTGTLDLGGAFQDFQTFVAGIGNSNETYYNIVLPQTGEFEVGRGVVTDASPDTLSRLEVFTSSNNNNLVDFSAGTKTVFCTLPANKFVPGKFEGANFADSILIGHATTGTLNAAEDNTGIGIEALDAITSGDANIAIGSEALTNLTTAIDNTVVGTHSGTSIVGGNFNTIFGKGSGNAINSGTYNIILGRSTNTTSTTGSGNVMIGNERQPSSNSVNGELKIGNFIPGTGSLDWISGDNTGALTFADKVVLGANKVIEFGDSSDTIKGDGTKITVNSSGRLDLLGTSVYLNGSGTTAVLFSSQGVQFGALTKENGTDLVLKSSVSDGDLVLRGNDGGSAIDALSFDMSEAGAATFNAGITATTGTISGDLTVDTNTLHVDSSNNRVGINTTSPTQALTIDGGNAAKIQFLGGGFQSIYYGDSGSPTAGFVHYDHNSDNYQVDVSGTITLDAPTSIKLSDNGTQFGQLEDSSNDFVISSVVQDKDIVFKGNDGGSTITALRLDMSTKGRVTIGSNNFPAERLSVFGEDNTAPATLKVKDTDSRGVLIESPYSGFGVGYVGTDGTNSALGFKVNGTEVGRFGTNGFFGVGTNAPQEELHINGADPSIRIQDSDGGLTKITQAGNDLSFDTPGQINLDADSNGLVTINDGGTQVGSFFKTASTFSIKSDVQDKRLEIKGNDGGSEVTAVAFHMANAGQANFNDKIILNANKVIEFGDSGETISGDGTNLTIASSQNLVLDTANELKLDSIAGINLLDNGSSYGLLSDSSGDFVIKSQQSDKDIIIKGNDGGSTVNALTFDMSEGGDATFNAKIILPANESLELGDPGESIFGDGSGINILSSGRIDTVSNDTGTQSTLITSAGGLYIDSAETNRIDAGTGITNFYKAGTLGISLNIDGNNDTVLHSRHNDKDIKFDGQDNNSTITALTLDMSAAGAATFNDKVILGANKVIEFGDSGETISGDGTDLTIVSSNDATIDVAGQINLDSGDIGRIHLKHDGTTYGHILRSGQNLEIKSSISDGDFEVHGNDGGVSINAFKLDMSEAGAATFNSTIKADNGKDVILGKNGGTNFSNSLLIGHNTTGTLSSAEKNTGVGDVALDALTSGDRNTAVGRAAGSNISSSSDQTVIGNSAGANLSTGDGGNVAIGSDSIFYNTTGVRNVAVGTSALQGASGQSPDYSVGIGYQSLLNITTGDYNLALGTQAGKNITSGKGNVIIGTVDAASATGDRQLKISGYDGSSTTNWISGDSSGNITVSGTVTANGETLSAGVSAGFAVAMAIAL